MDSVQKDEIALKILRELLQYRRRFPGGDTSIAEEEQRVTQVQLPRIRAFIENEQRIEFVLPAFPTKSPNTNKVIGAVPDMAERLSLIFPQLAVPAYSTLLSAGCAYRYLLRRPRVRRSDPRQRRSDQPLSARD